MVALCFLLRWAAGWWLFWRLPRCGSPGPALSGVKLSIIIPARNEELSLPRLLGSLARQTLVPHEIIVVNDHSTDATPEVARLFGAALLNAADPPPGWIGKTWACWTGARSAQGELLLF